MDVIFLEKKMAKVCGKPNGGWGFASVWKGKRQQGSRGGGSMGYWGMKSKENKKGGGKRKREEKLGGAVLQRIQNLLLKIKGGP